MAAALLMTLPVAIIFFTFKRYIVRTGAGASNE
jgi:ABC-type glycerol-3-phosphate transport system permease component